MKLANVVFLGHCNVAAFDAQGRQVGSQQQPAHYRVLCDMAREGVLAPDTLIDLPGHGQVRWDELQRGELAEWLQRGSDEPPEEET